MNRNELIDRVTERARRGRWDRPVTKANVLAVIACLGDVLLEDVLLQGDRVSLPRVGTFAVKRTRDGKPFWTFDFSSEAETAVQAHGGEVMQ